MTPFGTIAGSSRPELQLANPAEPLGELFYLISQRDGLAKPKIHFDTLHKREIFAGTTDAGSQAQVSAVVVAAQPGIVPDPLCFCIFDRQLDDSLGAFLSEDPQQCCAEAIATYCKDPRIRCGPSLPEASPWPDDAH